MRWITFLGLFLVAGSLQAAQVVSVDSSIPGTYISGNSIDIVVHFNGPVSTTIGTSKLLLNVGRAAGDDAYAYANVAATNSNNITLTYLVQPGDNSGDLDYSAITALTGVTNMVGNLPTPGSVNSLSQTSALVIDTQPVVRSVSTSLTAGTYGLGQDIPITVLFSEPVTLAKTPGTPAAQLTLQLNGSTKTVTADSSGNGTAQLVFHYSVLAGENVTALDYLSTSSLTLTALTTLQDTDSPANDAVLTLPLGGSSSLRTIQIDTTAPVVTNITSTAANGSYKAGDSIPITVQFSEAVFVTGSPTLTLNTTGGAPGTATYLSGSNSTTLAFTYSVGASQVSADLDAANLVLTSATIADSSGNLATTAVPTGASTTGALKKNKDIRIAVPSTISAASITNPSTGSTITTAGTASIKITFSGSPTITGSGATLKLETGTVDHDAVFSSISGSDILFTYTVQAGDNTAKLDYTSINALTIGGVIVDGFTGMSFTLPALGGGSSLAVSNIQVDTTPSPLAPPTFTLTPTPTVSSTAPVTVAIVASEAVTGFIQSDLTCTNCSAALTGASPTYSAALTPISTLYAGTASSAGSSVIRLKAVGGSIPLTATMPLQIGSTTVFVAADVSVTTTLTDVTLTNALSTALAVNADVWLPRGETLQLSVPANAAQDLAGNNSTAASPVSVVYDPTPPVATVTAPANYTSPLIFTIDFSEDVSTLTASALTTSNGILGALTSINPKKWTVAITPSPMASGNVGLQVKSNVVVDQASNPNLASEMTSFIPLSVTQIATNPVSPRACGVGDVIDLIMTLNRTVNFIPGASPATLVLETGAIDHPASLILPAATGSTNTLTFRYTVVADDVASDLDVTSASALNLQGGSIDSLTVLTVPAPGAAGSLSATSAVSIDTIKPDITLETPLVTGALQAVMTINFSEAIDPTTLTAGDFTLPSNMSIRSITIPTSNRTATVAFNLQPSATTASSFTVQFSGSVSDTVNNASTVTRSTTFTYDPVPPILTLSGPINDQATTALSALITSSKYVTGMAIDDCNVTNGVASSISAAVGTMFRVALTPTSTLKLGQAAAIGVNTLRLQATSGDVTLPAGSVVRLVDAGVTTVVRLTTTNDTLITSLGATVGIETAMPVALAAGASAWPSTGVVVTTSVRANACTDSIGQNNPAPAAPIAVRYDPTPPMFRASVIAYTYDGDIVYTVTSSEPVNGFSATGIDVTNCVVAGIESGSSSDRWTVYVTPTATTSLTLGIKAGAATDNAGNASLAEAPAPFPIVPRIVHMSCNNADGTYNPGMRLVIKVVFTENVTVTGFPHLALNLTPTGRDAIYKSGSGTKELLFDYTIVEGDATDDLDYLTSRPFTLPDSAAIFDADSHRAALTLGVPGNPNSLAANSAIVVKNGDAAGPGKPGIGDQPAGSGGCGAGSGIALILAGGWLGLGVGLRRRRRAA